MNTAYINRIRTAVPVHDVHASYFAFMRDELSDERARKLFARMAERSGISHRYSVLGQHRIDDEGACPEHFYQRGKYPSTAARMRVYEREAPALAEQAVAGLELNGEAGSITHLIVTSCTGFVAPGVDQLLAKRLGLRADLQRTVIGFMGCAAAVPALRLAQATVCADQSARVLIVNIELCTLHLQETDDLEVALSFLVFADGCAAALVSAQPAGFEMGPFKTGSLPGTEGLITWHIGDHGFVMHLDGKVPGEIAAALRADGLSFLGGEGTQAIDLWAVHGGGRTVLDAVQTGLSLPEHALAPSRAVLDAFGNMSSATVMFVLSRMLESAGAGQRGIAMAFGPGMVVESFRFRAV